jgi:hypothetical protein
MSRVAVIPVADIHLDPARFQFRSHTGKSGTNGRLRGVKRWNENLAGIISVWRDDSDGQVFCVNGHHRLNLARRCHVERVAVRYIDAANDREARSIGALVNLAEGSGTMLDFAKVLRSSMFKLSDLESYGITPSADLVKNAVALWGLDEYLFNQVVQGKLPESAGILIGAVGEPERQLELVRLRNQLGWTDAVLAEACQLSAEAEQAEQQGRVQVCFPGLEAPTLTDLTTRLAVRAAVRARLRSQIRALQAACQATSRRWLKAANCTIDTRAARTQRATAERLLALFDQRANRPGSLNTFLGELVVECRDTGAQPDAVVAGYWDLVPSVIEGCAAEMLAAG